MNQTKLSLIAFLILCCNFAFGQATINNVNLSYYNQTCNDISVPITADLCGFTAGDTISGTLDYGDGTVINLTNYAVNPSFMGCDTTYFQVNYHNYATPNTYTITAVLNGPNATSVTTTMVINSSNCFYYSGSVFNDLNNNCIQDIGELPCKNISVEAYLNNFLYSSTITDINGTYVLNSTALANNGYTIKLGTPTGGTTTCPTLQSYTPAGLIASNLNFGLNIPPALSVQAFNTFGSGSQYCASSYNAAANLLMCNMPTANISVNIDFGDGTPIFATIIAYNPQNTISCENFSLDAYLPNHIYAVPGPYTLTLTASIAGYSTSSTTNLVAVSCSNFSGNLFQDANTNCINDIGEFSQVGETIVLLTGGNNYYAFSDGLGNYNFSIPNTMGAFVSISPFNLSNLTCTSTYTTVATNGTNFDFAYATPAPTLTASLTNYIYCNNLNYDNPFMITQCGSNSPITAIFDFGDGTPPLNVANFIMSSSQNGCTTWTFPQGNLQHTYTSYGTYTITASITDGTLSTTATTAIYLSPCAYFNGTVFIDANSNCVSDPGEALAFQTVNIEDTSGAIVSSSYSDINGNYSTQFQFTNGASYIVSPDISGPLGGAGCYNVTCPSSLNYLVNTPLASNLDFGFLSSSANFDNTIAGISLGCCGILQAGTSRTIRVNYMNLLCAANNGDLTLTLEPNMTYNWANPAPTSVTGNVITWNFSNINNSNWNNFVDVNVSIPFLNNNGQAYITGDSVCLSSTISSTSGVDINLNNNSLSTCFSIGTAYDPNDKNAFPKGEGIDGLISKGTDIEYVIRFQNTGAAPAQQVFILDTLDNNLDTASIKILGSSHNMVLTKNGRALRFSFPNIMLPDSSSNLDASQGFVRYLAKQKLSVAYGAKIYNKAFIHFDAQAPVVTNQTKHTIKIPTNVNTVNNIKISVYPNPIHDKLFIEIPNSIMQAEISVTDAIGKLVYQSFVELNNKAKLVDISTSSLVSGVYFVNVKADGKLFSYKVRK